METIGRDRGFRVLGCGIQDGRFRVQGVDRDAQVLGFRV